MSDLERPDLWREISQQLTEYSGYQENLTRKWSAIEWLRKADYVFSYMFDENGTFARRICEEFRRVHGGVGLIYQNTWGTEVGDGDPTCYVLFDPSKAKIVGVERL